MVIDRCLKSKNNFLLKVNILYVYYVLMDVNIFKVVWIVRYYGFRKRKKGREVDINVDV